MEWLVILSLQLVRKVDIDLAFLYFLHRLFEKKPLKFIIDNYYTGATFFLNYKYPLRFFNNPKFLMSFYNRLLSLRIALISSLFVLFLFMCSSEIKRHTINNNKRANSTAVLPPCPHPFHNSLSLTHSQIHFFFISCLLIPSDRIIMLKKMLSNFIMRWTFLYWDED